MILPACSIAAGRRIEQGVSIIDVSGLGRELSMLSIASINFEDYFRCRFIPFGLPVPACNEAIGEIEPRLLSRDAR